MSHKATAQKGFTVIELTLAMAFLSFILIFVVLAVTQLLGVYNKGLTVKSINQAGRSISGEMQRTIRDANANAIDTSRVANGRLCTGSYSYIWSSNNTGVTPAVPTNNFINRRSVSGAGLVDINFARIYDSAKVICSSPTASVPPSFQPHTTELISERLQVRSLQVLKSQPDNPGLFVIRFVITSDDETGIASNVSHQGSPTDSDFFCRVDDMVTNQFCAANLFVTYAYAKN